MFLFFFLCISLTEKCQGTAALCCTAKVIPSAAAVGQAGAGLGSLPVCAYAGATMGLHLRNQASEALLSCYAQTPAPKLVWLWAFM